MKNNDSMFDNRNAKIILAIVGALYIIYIQFIVSDHPVADAFYRMEINDKIRIIKYNHDVPTVYLKQSGKEFILFTPRLCSKYLMNNDSIVKTTNSNFIKVIRDSANFRITTTWAMYRDHYENSLQTRQTVNKSI